MPHRSPLKVYRTTIGFHDAYVAAPSQKAALEAWGAKTNLFEAKLAEQVTDPELLSEPLAKPGTPVLKSRGTMAEHLAAMKKNEFPKPQKGKQRLRNGGALEPVRARRGSRNTTAALRKPKPAPPPAPRPTRKVLDEAEDALRVFQAGMQQRLAGLREREKEIREESEVLRREQREGQRRLQARVSKASEDYEAAMQRWLDRTTGKGG